MKKFHLYILVVISLTIFSSSCNKDVHSAADHESINQMNFELTSTAGNVLLSFNDPDGDGGVAPTIAGGSLKANTVYTGTIKFFAQHGTHFEDLTPEILAEGTKHQLFFSSTLAGVTVSYDDKDASNNPIGLSTKLTTTGAGTGVLRVILRHEPNKTAANVSAGDVTNAGGETDVDVNIPITVI